MARRESFSVNQLLASTINGFPFPGGIGMGKAFYVAKATTAYTNYRDWLVTNGVDPNVIFATIDAAEDATVNNRGDVVFVFPGTYTLTSKLAWDKSNTHLIGVGSEMQRTPAVTNTTGAVYLTSTTVGQTTILEASGHYNVFANFGTKCAAAASIADITVLGRVNRFKNLYVQSGDHATQLASVALGYAVSFPGGVAGYGNNNTFEDCHLGESRNPTKTLGGVILFETSGGVSSCNQQNEFKRCFIQQRCDTDVDCAAVRITTNYAVDRHLLFEACTFYNFSSTGTILTGDVFHDDCATEHRVLLTHGTCQYGWDAWLAGGRVFNASPVAHGQGGTMLVAV